MCASDITVKFTYIILNTKPVGKPYEEFGEFQADLLTFKKWCRHYLLGLKKDGNPPYYRLDDVYALQCSLSDGRTFIWQQHSVDKYGNKRGGWKKI